MVYPKFCASALLEDAAGSHAVGMPNPTLRFLGAVRTVTGSRFLLDDGSTRVLVDAGLYQGVKELRRRNWDPPPFELAHLDAIVLTHAHLDHCGFLPALHRRGYLGPVYATAGTIALANIVLPDAGRLQEEEARYANKRGSSRHNPALPLFTEDDALGACRLLRKLPFGGEHAVGDGVTVVMQPAGHILGAATVTATLSRGGRRVTFSGDIGRPSHPILVAPSPRPESDVLLIESTYGDRTHDDAGLEPLARAIRRTVERGGTVVIPAFAVDRTELLLHALRTLEGSGSIPKVAVIVDSPMALASLAVYRAAIASRSPEIRPELLADPGNDPFTTTRLIESHSVEESKAATALTEPSIVISASGMATGGRVLHHLAQRLPDPRNTVILAGYQAQGTRGRKLVDGATELKIHGRYIPVRAEVVNLSAFSAHADSDELLQWAQGSPTPPETVYVVHGEPRASAELRKRLQGIGWTAVVPIDGEHVLV